ncbi:MAG: UDP-N-acetylmuramoyl-L-alanyl-D-glutamate--2,6-diaminopimelate ligase [Clostridia bacterium]|nr:UDP-N-acetylmuramoyl-L-alanyl-D-glutamate--2,6-diaminopimelate ligase [Clostridia bacterium]
MKLKQLCSAAALDCPREWEDAEITAIVSNTAHACPGGLFVCIRGLRTDSHTLVGEAVQKGVTCIVVQEGCAVERIHGVLYLVAKDTRATLSDLCNAWYGDPVKQLKIIGVTGTNGKTTVTHMLRRILEASFYKCGLIGTVGCESAGRHLEKQNGAPLSNMTTPDPEDLYRMLAEMVRDGVEYVLMEVTSHALALGKLHPIHFEAAIFTNLTPDHLDFHGTMEAYADAKAILFGQSRISILHTDSDYTNVMRSRATGRVVTCTCHRRTADYAAEEITYRQEYGVHYRLTSPKSSLWLQCPVPGTFTVSNSMQAAICALELGIGSAKVQDALATMSGVKGRMERLKLGMHADFSVIVDYAHTPDALENLLQTVAGFKQKHQRTVLVFGCGGDRDQGKRPMMGRLASTLADEVIVTSDNSRSEDPMKIISQICSGMAPQSECRVIPDRRQAIEYAILHAKAGDVILLAGKGHEEYEITREGRRPFSEKKIVQEALAARLQGRKQTDSTETES